MSESPTKKVRIVLAALTRVEFTEVLEVPAGMTPGELEDLVEQRYQDVDGGEFYADNDYWEKASCRWERERDDAQASGVVVASPGGGFELVKTPANPEQGGLNG